MIVHACHCRWCQREFGTAFALNALIETNRMAVAGDVEIIDAPSNSGKGQQIARCPHCKIALWSNYGGATDLIRFVRVGTIDNPDAMPPDIHIFAASKQPWLTLPKGARSVAEYYHSSQVWPAERLARRKAALG